MDKNRQAVVKTLLYSDIFDYPLKIEEIYNFLISESPVSLDKIRKVVVKESTIKKKNGFYFLEGRNKLVSTRETRAGYSSQKMRIAVKAANLLSKIPSIYLISVSGSLAVMNAKDEEDIDFFIITAPGTIWISRLLSIILLKFSGKYRSKGQARVRNKICLNMFLSSEHLELSDSRKNIYTAKEISQSLPLFERKGTYLRFLKSNKWIYSHLANFVPSKRKITKGRNRKFLAMIMSKINYLAKLLQTSSIKRTQTSEEVSDLILAFHPGQNGKRIENEFQRRCKKYEKA